MADPRSDAYDLLIVVDATASMTIFLRALEKSLPEIISLSALTGCFERIGIVAYRDYCGGPLTEWSGWCSPSGAVSGPEIVSQEHLLSMAGNIGASHGGDWPEATKTGLARAYQEMRADATTVMLLYTDAPPHFAATGGSNYDREKAVLDKDSYGGNGHLFVDWVSAAMTFKAREKRAIVFSVVWDGQITSWSPYLYLSAMTGGASFTINSLSSENISQLTLGILLTWMGAATNKGDETVMVGQAKRYLDTSDLEQAGSEDSTVLDAYFVKTASPLLSGLPNIQGTPVAMTDIPAHIQARGPNIPDFAKRYVEDEAYKKLAIEQLRRIIASNVSAVSVNPIFGTLWRAVCTDRTNEARDELVTLFGREVDRIKDTSEKGRMKVWLEESYDYAAEIQGLIAEVSAEEGFPLVFLDPTEDFTSTDAENYDDRPLNQFTRVELLEIGRSCDYRILRRLGKVLTRLTYVEKEEDLPEHIKHVDVDQVPQIPMALANAKHQRKFWQVLLHAVLPGTKITPRPAAVLAALALRMGILPLRDVADKELVAFRTRWNNVEVPETWNIGCLSLLLDADEDYETRVSKGITIRPSPEGSILREQDRKLFKTLVDYKMLEMNLKTTLQASISWKPEKAKVALGPLVVCQKCQYPRSVTIMGPNGVCGLCTPQTADCQCQACIPEEDHAARVQNNVSHDHHEASLGYWVECKRITCQGQYVLYNPDALRVRAKCYYCRHEDGKSARVGRAPVVECRKCLSRVIWPEEYRPKNLDLSEFECPACQTDVVTIITKDTSAKELEEENGREWLLRNEDEAIVAPFDGRSLFYTATHCTLDNLPTKVEVLPSNDSELRISGKLVRNAAEVKQSLQRWVLARRTEAGVCSLCFSDIRKDDLRPACGRSGCAQQICNGCCKGWYGLNARGRLINVAALSCPFCRRRPAPKTIAAFGLAHMGNLRTAVDDAGSWIYAWCARCGFAKQYVERACAAGAPPELRNWSCEECQAVAVQGSKPQQERECPGCGVVTEKMGGCDHISCPCGTHWCYACGEDVGVEGIYEHIGREHGGLWDEDGDGEEDVVDFFFDDVDE